MSFRIERVVAGKTAVVLEVSGHIEGDHVGMLRELIGQEKGTVVIDLNEVTLVDRDAIRLLAASEAGGTHLRRCPAYIREWLSREKDRIGKPGPHPRTAGPDDLDDI